MIPRNASLAVTMCLFLVGCDVESQYPTSSTITEDAHVYTVTSTVPGCIIICEAP